MAILDILATVYFFCLVNALVVEALDLWLDAQGTPKQRLLVVGQQGSSETAA